MRSALPDDQSKSHEVKFLPGAVVSGLFHSHVSFAAEVYRVLGWHEGSVGSRKV